MQGRSAVAAVLGLVVCCSLQVSAQPCSASFKLPGAYPTKVDQYNGEQLEDVCISHGDPYHVYVIGDWGGIVYHRDRLPVPADKRSVLFPKFRRKFVWGVDNSAQVRVMKAMEKVMAVAKADYILNVGDNFYWGGVEGHCGSSPFQSSPSDQWLTVFENLYKGPLAGIPWLGVLGNHDYGGYTFTSAWEQNVGYSWGGGDYNTRRWFQPALYWGQRVRYPGFSVDYLFVDSNRAEAWGPFENQAHNICGELHSGLDASCKPQGPDLKGCMVWFKDLWSEQLVWMQHLLQVAQRSTYQVIVTHFPAKWFGAVWACLGERYGIDLHISGHIHHQQIYGPDDGGNFLPGICSIVSGGGGGITSEGIPSLLGHDDQYGFVDLHFTADHIQINAISHGAKVRKKIMCRPRGANLGSNCGRRLAANETLEFV